MSYFILKFLYNLRIANHNFVKVLFAFVLDKIKSIVNGFVFNSFLFKSVLGLDKVPSEKPSVICLSVVAIAHKILFYFITSHLHKS